MRLTRNDGSQLRQQKQILVSHKNIIMIRKLLFLSVIFVTTLSINAQQYIIGSYNIRYANPRDSGNLWADRAPVVAALIRFHDFDLFGTQEGLRNQLDDISTALPYYERYGVGRDDGQTKGEHSAIYFKKDKFKLLKKGDFWLSETPDKPSLGWDATCCNRICSWVQLQDTKSKKKFYVFNAHFDHQGKKAREESAKLILEKIKSIAGNEPVIFMGDLNGSHTSTWYETIEDSEQFQDTYRMVEHPYALNASHNSFGKRKGRKDVIDHIFVTSHFIANKWGILTDTYDGKFPSDHFPILTVVKFM
jgi:endonuclease/exonuclease/phosphatase family metal-dependent hydrolase